MKKLVLSIIIGGAISVGFAQNNKVVSAWNYLKYQELDKAKEAIDAASGNAATSSKAKTWFYRGKIYMAIAESEKFATLTDDALGTAVESYLKAYEFETKKIDKNELDADLRRAANMVVNKGINEFNAKTYDKAVASFMNAVKAGKKFNITDSLSHFYGAVSAKNSGDAKKAINHFNKCIEIDYHGAECFFYLADVYQTQGDKDKYAETIKAGRAKYPEDSGLLTAEINLHLEGGNAEEALKTLNVAIEKDPSNALLFFARGNMYEKQGDLENAKKDYGKAIELDPENFDANYNLGALIFNNAVEEMTKVNEIKDNNVYAKEKERVDKIFLLSIPYLEKAHQIDATDKSTMLSLKQLYVRTGETDKYNDIKQKLEN